MTEKRPPQHGASDKCAPFFKADPRLWEEGTEAFPRPWPRALVLLDLQWWADQLQVGRVARIPGYDRLQSRWGWTEWKVRQVMRDHLPTTARLPHDDRTVAARSGTDVPTLSEATHTAPTRLPHDDHRHARVLQNHRSTEPPDKEQQLSSALPSTLTAQEPHAAATPPAVAAQVPQPAEVVVGHTRPGACACGRPLGRKAQDGMCAACLDRRAAGVTIPEPEVMLAQLPEPTPALVAAVQQMRDNAALPPEQWVAQIAATMEPEHPEERTRKVERKPRATKAPKEKAPTERQALIGAWSAAYLAATGSKYAWAFAGPDAREVRAWVELVAGGVPVDRLCSAMRAFCEGWGRGQVFGAAAPFPKRFNSEVNHWLQVATEGPVLTPKERADAEAARKLAEECEEIMVRALRRDGHGHTLQDRPDLAAAVARVDAQDAAERGATPRPQLVLVGA